MGWKDSFLEKIRYISIPISLMGGIGFVAYYTFYCLLAYLEGKHRVILDFNVWGEHLFEVFVFPAFLCFMAFALYTYFQKSGNR